INNSAYYEHLYLAKQMGVGLVGGTDLVVDDDHVFMRSTRGWRPVRVVYRGIDDAWVGPTFGRQEPAVAVGGRGSAHRSGDRRRAIALPRAFIGQPVVALSVQPALDGNGLRRGHQDLRPFVLTGPDSYVTPGGLTRVALTPGSLVVNSSQGGGSRDTWVVADD